MRTITKRILSLVLSFVMLVGVMPISALANEGVEETVKITEGLSVVTDGAETVQSEKSVSEKNEPEWVLPDCDCGSTESELDKHSEMCAQKVFLEELCKETAADIFAKWEKLPEACRKYVLECLSKDEADAEKLAELSGYVNAAALTSDEIEGNTTETEGNTTETEGNTTETEGNTTETEGNTTETEGNTTETEGNTEDPTEESVILVAEDEADTLDTSAPIVITDEISIPGYPSAKVSKTMEYDCGNGVAKDGSKSYLIVATDTDADDFADYKKRLNTDGYQLEMEKEVASDVASAPNLFASYTDSDGKYKLYTYHFPYYRETRIIIDTQKDTVEGFRYTAQTGETVKPMMVMYGLSMATNGYDEQLSSTNYTEGRRNCGALFVIRMPDNSLFIHDGGDIQQWSDNACDEFLAFCRELTGTTGTNEKMVINTWFLSHAHSDHFLGFPRFINKYHDHFELKNIMYNIDIERTYTTRDIHDIMELVSSHYPDVKYYKPHTGESFEIAGVTFDVMYSHEDRYLPTADGDLITDYPTIENGEAKSAYDIGGTYRDYSYDEPGVKTSKSDFNDTSVVLRVTFENGVDSILYADMNRAEQTLFDIYPDNAFKADIAMVPHHGFDAHPELMAKSDATIFLYTQHKQAIYGPDDDYTTEDADGTFRPKLRNNFIKMKKAIDAAGVGRTEGTDYKFYWGGSETVAIDINSMSGIATLAETGSEMPGMTLDTSAPNGITVYTAEANNDVYSNAWTVYDLDDGTSGETTVSGVSTGTTKNFRFEPATTLTVNKRYLIRSDRYSEYIMSYSPVAESPGNPNTPTSLVQNDAPAESTETNLFFCGSGDYENYIYLNHSNRDNALWILKQDGTSNDDNLAESAALEANFGGTAVYNTIRLYKGIGPTGDYNEDGTFADLNNGAYWYSVQGNDNTSPITQYRYLNPRYVNNLAWLKNEPISDSYVGRHVIEKFSDGTFLIYYRHSESDYRILACDENGNWGISRYTDATGDEYPAVAQITEDLPKLKVRLYVYTGLNEFKEVQFSGPTIFNVDVGTTQEQLLELIQQSIVVRDTTRRDLAIPGNGNNAKVGYYWLDFDKDYNPSTPGSYTVTVKYRNDNGTDTSITTLSVAAATLTVDEDMVFIMEGDPQSAIGEAIHVTLDKGSGTQSLAYASSPTNGSYYWLDFNLPFDSSASGSHMYTVSVKYRNDNDSDITAQTELTVMVKPLDVAFSGTTIYGVQEGVTEAAVRDMIRESITVTRNTLTDSRENVSYTASPAAGSYWLDFDSAFDSSASGDHDYYVSVKYRNADGTDTLLETLTVYVEQEITSWTAPADKVGTVPLNAGLTTITQKVEGETSSDITFTVNGETRYVTVGLLTKDGNRVDTSKAGTFTDLTLTYMGKVICNDFTLIVTESNEALNYPQEGQGGYVGVDKQTTTTTTDFKKNGVANIQLSATGTAPERGVDLIVVMDLSGSMKNEMGTNSDAANYADSRAAAMERSLMEMIKVLAESDVDVSIAMSDFGDVDHYELDGSVLDESVKAEAVLDANTDNGRYLSSTTANRQYEFTNQLNYLFRSTEALVQDNNGNAYSKIGTFANVHTKFNMAHPQYTGVITPTVYTGTGEVEADAFVDVKTLYQNGAYTSTWNGIKNEIEKNVQKSLGTNYDIGLEYAYQLGYAKQQENIASGNDRDIVCIFMSDGAAMQYNYFSGRSESQSWSDYLMGETDAITTLTFPGDSMPTELTEIAEKFLSQLENGKLYRAEYHRVNTSLKLYDADGNALYGGDNYTDEEYFLYRTRYGSSASFYTFMENMNYDLDWEFLCKIAKANGIADFDYAYYRSNPQMSELVAKLQVTDTLLGYEKVGNDLHAVYQSDLINPSLDETPYYPQFTGTRTGDNAVEQFMNAMSAVGVDCGWDLFFKIAYRNRNVDISGEKDEYEIEHALKAFINNLKSAGNGSCVTYSPYSYFYNTEGKSWWAEAIKGDTDSIYPVVNKYAKDGKMGSFHRYNGEVSNHYSTGTGLALDGKDYISGFRGLGIDMYTISFSISDDELLTTEVAEQVLKNIASGPSYFYAANSQDGLTAALKSIVGSMSAAATRAWFTDTMGDAYDLYVGQPETNYTKGDEISTIRVLEYALDANGERTGTPIVRETITIQDLDGDGDVDATSDQMYNTVTDSSGNITYQHYDIWDETTGLITGKFLYYNTNTSGTVPIPFGSQGTYNLPAETFFWLIGIIGETEMVLEYPVYLTGSMENTIEIPAGEVAVYDTNESADLHYVNYLGNDCERPTVTPSFPWGNPAVGYVFYLVDENGTPLDDQGRTTNFANSLKLSTAVYENLNTSDGNNITTITASDKLAATTLGNTYQLYNPSASYTVTYNESWRNDGGETTYVTNYGGAASNAATSAAAGIGSDKLDLEKTVVYFALVVTPAVMPDTVVVDYGLPVEINVLANDSFTVRDGVIQADVTGVAKKTGSLPTSGQMTASSGFDESAENTYGTLELLESNNVEYTMSSMEMPSEDVFMYAAKDSGTGKYYYSTVTVIPATTIYYEDGFVHYSAWNVSNMTQNNNEDKQWKPAGDAVSKDQAQDRPGEYSLPEVDANNIYGYDGAYTNMATHSLNSTMKFTANNEVYGEAQFTFWGTGFDVISLTSNTTGTVTVSIYDADEFAKDRNNASSLKNYMVDTYYGYKRVLCNVTYECDVTPENSEGHWVKSVDGAAAAGATENKAVLPANPSEGVTAVGVEYAWIVDDTASDALYQVPVMKVSGLNYDRYTAVITVWYEKALDHQNQGSYDFYLDAIRIYDPANDGNGNGTIQDAYVADGEGWPEYFELRNLIISRNDFNSLENGTGSGIVFIDNTLDSEKNQMYTIEDYTNYGPNNELYLAPGQSVAFKLSVTDPDLDQIHMAMKSVGGTTYVKYYDADSAQVSDAPVKEIATATDLYYDITSLNGKTVVITNAGESGDAILSITNVKVTYKQEHTDGIENTYFTITQEAASTAVASLMMMRPPVEPEVPEEPVEPEVPVDPEEPAEPEEPVEPEEPEVFDPQRFDVQLSDSSVKVGTKVTVTVTTGKDVEYITVNGVKLTKYTGSRFSSTRTWKVRVEAEEAGKMDVAVVCYNSDELASEAVVKTITVTQKQANTNNAMKDFITGIFSWFWGRR